MGIPAADLTLLLDVTSPSGVGWTNQTSYVFTRATPFSAVYDPVHGLVFSSNEVWNRVDVISDATHAVVQTISIRDPRFIDISVDGARVWVSSGSGRTMYAIDTTTLKATRYELPSESQVPTPLAFMYLDGPVQALADGTVLVNYMFWNPLTNALNYFSLPQGAEWAGGKYTRSGDGKHVFGITGPQKAYTYDVTSGTFSAPVDLSSSGAGPLVANQDGSRVAAGLTLYDGSWNELGSLPGGCSNWNALLACGGVVFSADGKTLYEETGSSTVIPELITIDVATLQPVSHAPAMAVLPTTQNGVLGLSQFVSPTPFGVDAAGMVLGVTWEGIAFDDPTPNFDYPTGLGLLTPGTASASTYSGPLTGGTTSADVLNAGFSIIPDVYYGATKGTATLSDHLLSITSPPSSAPGPVDIKMLFPDGTQAFAPQFFTYGTQLNDAVISGASPAGGVSATLDAFGLPLDPSQDTVLIGGNAGTVTSATTQTPPFTGEQTAMFLSYTTPPGTPGWADLTVTTPNGTGTLPKSFLFAKSVTDYPLSDSIAAVLYDRTRNQLYLSARDHIDVFSLTSLGFTTPISSPGSGLFLGLALTPDGKTLLAAAYGALTVIDPDSPTGAYEISLAGSVFSSTCAVNSPGDPLPAPTAVVQPSFVAADDQGNAFIGLESFGAYCTFPVGGPLYVANLAAKTSSTLTGSNCNPYSTGFSIGASSDGSLIGLDDQLYLPSQHSCIPASNPSNPLEGAAQTVAGDGNVVAGGRTLNDSSGNYLGQVAHPSVLYPYRALQNPALNDTGSLYFWAYPNYIDIVDVQHGTSALRFGLTETVANAVSPLAIDGSGQHVYLITDKGLTIVDLGEAPLSIGHLSLTAGAAGTQITVRGSGFEDGLTATLGGVNAPVAVTDSETLTLTVPAARTGLEDLVLSNPGGKTYTLQNALAVQ
jgi:hypothetical protein